MIRKIKKLFRNPKEFIVDSKIYRKLLKCKTENVLLFIGFSTWKKYIRKYFPARKIIFIDKNLSSKELINILRKYKKHDIEIFIWGYKINTSNLKLLQNKNYKINYVEDGFIRSVDLGASKSPPLSLCIDSKGAYFDSTKPTNLEELLNNYDFEKNKKLLEDAKNALSIILENKISKYNISPHCDIEPIYGKKTRKRVLVIGQVEDDASIKYGFNGNINNNDLVRIAVAENPDAQIIYKPHPDVMRGYRDMMSDPKSVEDICLVLKDDISLSSSLDTIDHVYTITSLSGFEALLRGIKVTTLGDAFYSNWGQTDDRQKNPRKKRRLSVEELFAIAYLVYPKYYDVETGSAININTAINIIHSSKKKLLTSLENTYIKNTNSALIYIDDIKILTQKGKWKEAEELCKKQWAITPWDLELTLLLAKNYRINYKFDQAIYLCEALSSRIRNYKVLIELFETLQARGDKSNNLKKILYDAINISPESNTQARVALIKYIWGTTRVGPELLGLCNKLSLEKSITPINRMLIAAIFCEAGRYLLAEKQYLIALEKDEKILLKAQYFHLLEHLNIKGYLNGNMSLIIESISKKIKKGQDSFIRTIKENAKTFSLVGNAPTEIGKGLGFRIDSADLVIRFNAYNIDYPYSEDYGRKTDIWVKTGAYLDVPRRSSSDFSIIIISGYNPANRNTMGVDLFFDFIESNAQICCIPNNIYEELFLKLGSPPSAGLAIAYWIYKIIGPVDKNSFFGFSFGDQKEHSSEHYFTNQHSTVYSSHLWDSEAIILRSCIK